MKCPRCEDAVLDEREREGVTLDVCRECRGVWLDRSELERIVARAVREQQELEPSAAAPQPPQPPAPPHAAPPGYAPGPYAPQPRYDSSGQPGYPPPQPGYPPPQRPYRRDDDTPPHGHYHGGHHRKRKKHWFESLSDIFD